MKVKNVITLSLLFLVESTNENRGGGQPFRKKETDKTFPPTHEHDDAFPILFPRSQF